MFVFFCVCGVFCDVICDVSECTNCLLGTSNLCGHRDEHRDEFLLVKARAQG